MQSTQKNYKSTYTAHPCNLIYYSACIPSVAECIVHVCASTALSRSPDHPCSVSGRQTFAYLLRIILDIFSNVYNIIM